MKRFFNNFQDLSLVDNAGLRRLGAPSTNGFVIEVPFVKSEHIAYNALKCAIKSESDNLFYEYFVGHYFINQKVKIITNDGRVYFGVVESCDNQSVILQFTRKTGMCMLRRSDIMRVQNAIWDR